MRRSRSLLLIVLAIAIVVGIVLFLAMRQPSHSGAGSEPEAQTSAASAGQVKKPAAGGVTNIYAHNLMLRKGPDFRVYVRWLRGELDLTRPRTNPSFDDPESFFLNIKSGVLRANIGDIANYLNSPSAALPVHNVKLWGDGDQIHLSATFHKVVSLPVELIGTISAAAGNRIQIHVTKINVLKIPFKMILGGLHVQLSSLIPADASRGISVQQNDLFLDTTKLLPPPRIRGELRTVRIVNPDLEEVFGTGDAETAKVEQWRNFLSLRGGALDFGKLSMRDVDLVMIDISQDAWFDLDLAHYQNQLTNGYTRITPQAGLQIFMPDLSQLPLKKAPVNTGIDWMKNRSEPVPQSVKSK